jgi:site-specific DNA recombinase
MAGNALKRLRCAVYTRKSTEEGLEQAFNSLDAQREACAAYVLSQRHEGWTLQPDFYDDGGFTGGNMERPGLKQLLADVKSGKVDVVVVYKVDRLTRSLADFAKIVDVLDAAGASFVSVTQAFNTTNSMGRLTLNVLLSFSQFEREVITERIRDKVAASKARGMWMGGSLPLGYDAIDKKLVPVPEEAATVRNIMERYLGCTNIQELREALGRQGVVSKRVTSRKGNVRGGVPFGRGALHHLLSNRTYIGEVVHGSKIYPGEHDAIVDRELFDRVQVRLAARTNLPLLPGALRCISLLAGMIRDEHGRPMSPVHTRNHGKRYSYYASNIGDGSKDPVLRLPAGDLDHAVRSELRSLLCNPSRLRELGDCLEPALQMACATSGSALAGTIAVMSTAELRRLLQRLALQVTVTSNGASAQLIASHLLGHLGYEAETDQVLALAIAASTSSWGHEPRLRLDPPAGTSAAADANLIQLVARAIAARDELLTMTAEQADAAPITRLRHTERTARLAYLAPDIIRAILDGNQPRTVTARRLARLGSLPLSWTEQRRLLGFPAL